MKLLVRGRFASISLGRQSRGWSSRWSLAWKRRSAASSVASALCGVLHPQLDRGLTQGLDQRGDLGLQLLPSGGGTGLAGDQAGPGWTLGTAASSSRPTAGTPSPAARPTAPPVTSTRAPDVRSALRALVTDVRATDRQADRFQERRRSESTCAMRPAAVRWPGTPASASASAKAASSTMGTARSLAAGQNSGRPAVLAAWRPYARQSGEIATVSVNSSKSVGSGARCRAPEAAANPGCARFHSTSHSSAVWVSVLTVAAAAPPRSRHRAGSPRASSVRGAVPTAALPNRRDAYREFPARFTPRPAVALTVPRGVHGGTRHCTRVVVGCPLYRHVPATPTSPFTVVMQHSRRRSDLRSALIRRDPPRRWPILWRGRSIGASRGSPCPPSPRGPPSRSR